MTKRTTAVLFLSMGLALSVGLRSVVAEAQERKSPLADAPAIRKRLELRATRFEIGAGLGSTVGQDFYHAVVGTVRAGFHLTDWLSIGGMAAFNITPGFKTSFHDRLSNVLPPNPVPADRAPTQDVAEQSMNKIGQIYALQAELIPFAGKYSLFSKLFMNYDLYLFGGPGFINFTADGDCATPSSCPVTGMKVGGNFGVGIHTYINDFVAINAEFRNILVKNNPSGRDEDGDMIADKDDLSWDANYLFTLNVMFFLPREAEKSR